MNAIVVESPPTERDLAKIDWLQLIDFIDRWNIAECVLCVTRSRYGFAHTISIAEIDDIERAFAGTGVCLRLWQGKAGNLFAEVIVEGVSVGACGRPNGRVAGEVTL